MNQNYNVPLPSSAQLAYHEEELAAFIHFGMNTFYEREWGDGMEDPAIFNPKALDADQWIKILKETGFKRVILVVKHHDGFVLYPSKYTDYTVALSPWRDGEGDLLLEVSKAVTKYDMGLGIYLSPWDVHDERYTVVHQDAYNAYYLDQLKEILENPAYGNNGRFVEIWMDGARGEGAQKVTYDFEGWFEYIRSRLGDDVCIFSEDPTSVRWIGNESGRAGDPLWQRVSRAKMAEKKNSDPDYLNHGDPAGDMYSVGEADVSIRSGWFYAENQHLKSVPELLSIYFDSVGRGAPLLLNIPPNKEGQFAEEDVAVLRGFRKELDRIQATEVLDQWTRTEHLDGWEYEFQFDEVINADLIELKEAIANGQRIGQFIVSAWLADGWQVVVEGTTLGAKRWLLTDRFETNRLKVTILDAIGKPALSSMKLYDSGLSQKETISNEKNIGAHVSVADEKISVKRGEPVTIHLMKTGEKNACVALSTHPDTAVHGRHYRDNIQNLNLEEGRHSVQIATVPFTIPETPVRFHVRIVSDDAETAVIGTGEIEVTIL
ncbi:alpha-L-fucosidase [Jeotgalibaca sp. A122]|uniref:alpha-L-fucosidase n=1 Tax=Jeotgalibaca sp. A122 TaxID=3457322 RepID=UPI003FD5B0F1